MAAYWEIAAHSAYNMFSLYKDLSFILVIPTPRFVEWGSLSDCTFFEHCLRVPFHTPEGFGVHLHMWFVREFGDFYRVIYGTIMAQIYLINDRNAVKLSNFKDLASFLCTK